jgi:hypothetical protein
MKYIIYFFINIRTLCDTSCTLVPVSNSPWASHHRDGSSCAITSYSQQGSRPEACPGHGMTIDSDADEAGLRPMSFGGPDPLWGTEQRCWPWLQLLRGRRIGRSSAGFVVRVRGWAEEMACFGFRPRVVTKLWGQNLHSKCLVTL